MEGHVVEGRDGENDSEVAWGHMSLANANGAVKMRFGHTDDVWPEEEDVLAFVVARGIRGVVRGAVAVELHVVLFIGRNWRVAGLGGLSSGLSLRHIAGGLRGRRWCSGVAIANQSYHGPLAEIVASRQRRVRGWVVAARVSFRRASRGGEAREGVKASGEREEKEQHVGCEGADKKEEKGREKQLGVRNVEAEVVG